MTNAIKVWAMTFLKYFNNQNNVYFKHWTKLDNLISPADFVREEQGFLNGFPRNTCQLIHFLRLIFKVWKMCVSFVLEDMVVKCGLFGFQERNESESQRNISF